MSIVENTELSPREHILLEHETEETRLSREHAIKVKELELELAREKYKAEIELKKLEAKWSSWLRLPSMVIKLPVYILLGVGYIVSCSRKYESSRNFWNYLK